MNVLAFFSVLFTATMAQRGSYSGILNKGYPEEHPKFRNPNETDVVISNRLGEVVPGADNPNIPTDARGDVNLVNRLKTWPRENQPFWLLNEEHIERHRNPERGNSSGAQTGNAQIGNVQTGNAMTRNDQNDQVTFQTNINNQNTEVRSRVNDENIRFTQSRFGGDDRNFKVRGERRYYSGQQTGNV